jgi:predicted NACHT family NTPase
MPVGSILQSLFVTAIGRAVPILYQKILRRRKVDAAIRGEATQNSAIKKALMDYEVIVGSTYGTLTETLDKFLRELESSGVIVCMAEEAVVKRRTESTRAAFLNLHTEVFGDLSGNAQALYEQIAVSFETSLELLIADPAIALLIKSLVQELSKRLDRIEECTSVLLLAKPSSDSQKDIVSTFHKVNRALATRYKDIRVETNRGARQVAIDRIYIPSKLRVMKIPQALEEIISLETGGKRNRDRLAYKHPDEQMNRITFGEFRSGFRRAIVLGDPGGGKSTLCQYLCYNLAKQSNLAHQYDSGDHGQGDDGKFDPQVMKIPLRVVLRSFEGARLTVPQLTVFDYLANDLRSVITLSIDQLQDFLRYMLMYGYAVLAFDGLDEILNTGTRRDFVDMVTAFCNEFPLCPVFVTSRLVGYLDAPLPDDFEEFTLEKFDDKEVIQYLAKFLKIFDNEKQPKALERAELFLRQTHDTASDLRQNPLMLGLMAFLFVTKGDVPTNRPEIYKECAVLMFEKWDQNRNIKADIPLGFDMLHLFGEVASEIYGNPKLEEGVSEEWINKKNIKYFMNVYEDKAKAYEAGKK